MKRMPLVLALLLPLALRAGVPAPQAAPAQPPAHQSVFQLRYVLLPAPREAGELPRIDYDHRPAAMVPLQLDRWGFRQLDPFASNPNVEICRQWACEVPGQR